MTDEQHGTFGWFAFASGTVGITQGQMIRLSVVNVGAVDTNARCGYVQNPHPSMLVQESFTLQAGEARDYDLSASEISKEHFDKSGRVQVRAVVSSSACSILANLEVFDEKTGKTSIILALHELSDR